MEGKEASYIIFLRYDFSVTMRDFRKAFYSKVIQFEVFFFSFSIFLSSMMTTLRTMRKKMALPSSMGKTLMPTIFQKLLSILGL